MQFLTNRPHWLSYWLKLSAVGVVLSAATFITGTAGINWWRGQQQRYVANTSRQPFTTAQSPLPLASPVAVDVNFTICAESPSWVRPSPQEQEAQLQLIPRYQGQLNQEPLKGLAQYLQTQSIFTFTSYGISLRLEPIYLSGLWSVQDVLQKCYDPNRIAQFNNGQLAEVWVLFHRVVSIKWVGSYYVMVVEPTAQGVQFIQFPRSENYATLPINVVTSDGKSLEVFNSSILAESSSGQ